MPRMINTHLTKKSMAKYNQGIFKPLNPAKCKNPPSHPCVFRSSWEAQLFRWCDRNANVLEWSSEQHRIPYVHPLKKISMIYVPDVWVKIKNLQGDLEEQIIEVKPLSETPGFALARYKETGRKPSAYRQSVLLVNNSKFKAAEFWCKAHGMKFILMTENEIRKPRRVIENKTNMQLVRGKRKPKRR